MDCSSLFRALAGQLKWPCSKLKDTLGHFLMDFVAENITAGFEYEHDELNIFCLHVCEVQDRKEKGIFTGSAKVKENSKFTLLSEAPRVGLLEFWSNWRKDKKAIPPQKFPFLFCNSFP